MELLGVLAQGGVVLLDKVPANLVFRDIGVAALRGRRACATGVGSDGGDRSGSYGGGRVGFGDAITLAGDEVSVDGEIGALGSHVGRV